MREIRRDSDAYRFLMSGADEGIYVFGNEIEDCNEVCCRIWARRREDLIGRSPLEFSPELQADGSRSEVVGRQRFESAFAGQSQWFRWQYIKGDDDVSEALVHLELIRVDGRRRLLVRWRDLLDLERAEHAVAETETRFQQILDHTPVIAYAKDRAGRHVFANRQLERLAGRRRDQILGRTDEDLFPAEVAARLQANDRRVIEGGSALEFEETVRFGNEDRTYLSIKFPILDKRGNAAAVGGISTDITERKRADAALRQAALAVSSAEGERVFEELARSLAAVVGVEWVVIAVHHERQPELLRTLAFLADGTIRANVEYPIAGTPCADVCGREFMFIPSGVEARYPEDPMLPGMRVTGYAGYPLADASGRSLGLIALLSARPMRDAALVESMVKIYAVRAVAEIERQRVEAALRASESSHRAIFESAEDAIFIHDAQTGAIVDVNPRACALYGYTRAELLAAPLSQLCANVPPYTAAEAHEWMHRAKTLGPQRFEWHRRNRDGSLHWDEVVLKTAEIGGTPRVLAFTREITDRKLAEARLLQSQKMEALGHLTGGIAHDFNNLLSGIMGNLVLAADRDAALSDPRLSRYLDQAMLSSKKARDLIRQMLTYSRGSRGERRLVAMPALVDQSVKLLRSSLPSTIDVTVEIETQVCIARLDPVQVEQALMNLCINARDAMRSQGRIRVGVFRRRGVKNTCASCRQEFAGDFIELSVADDGPGIAPEVAERMFEPFYSTKEPGKGSGMGLSTVHGALHEHGGHVVVETSPGSGACFRLFIPPTEGDPDAVNATIPPARRLPRARLDGRLLLVDDEETVLSTMRDMLDAWGLEVTAVPGSREALAAFEANPAHFDVVLTDQTMPHLTGLELARELHRARPDLPVLLYSGFGGAIAPGKLAEAGVRALLSKPVEPPELLAALEAALGQKMHAEGLER